MAAPSAFTGDASAMVADRFGWAMVAFVAVLVWMGDTAFVISRQHDILIYSLKQRAATEE